MSILYRKPKPVTTTVRIERVPWPKLSRCSFDTKSFTPAHSSEGFSIHFAGGTIHVCERHAQGLSNYGELAGNPRSCESCGRRRDRKSVV